MNRRGFLIGSVLTPLLARSGSAPAADAARLAVPPPGSDSVADLLQRCKACGQCLSKCPSHLLKRTELGYGLSGAGMPRMDFSQGFCPPDCNACAGACSAGAIRPFKAFEKRHMRQAVAVVRLADCLAAKDGKSCGACAGKCPYQAVKTVRDANGRMVPEVVATKCAGCGACEFACPAKAIRVVGNREEPAVAVPEKSICDVPRLLAIEGSGFTVCNVGSSTGKFGFDWQGAGVRGLNLATQPQTLEQGFQLLRHFGDRLAKDCAVIVPICPFSSILPHYDFVEHQFKLYPFARKEEIPFWSPARARAVEKAVAAAVPRWTGDGALLQADRDVSPAEFEKSVGLLCSIWKKGFAIEDFGAPLTARNGAAFAETGAMMRRGLEMCVGRGWRPVVVLPPISRYYDKVFGERFWKTYVGDFVRDFVPAGVPCWNYGHDGRFRADSHFFNSLQLNRRGRAAFTAEILGRVRSELGLTV